MFGLFTSQPFKDPVLGTFAHARGLWRGTIVLADVSVPLAVAGTRRVPDPEALTVARRLPASWSDQRRLVARALVEHMAPYVETSAQPADVWQSVSLRSVAITALGGKLIAEVALAVDWDEEHVLGARFDGGSFVELNGSILPA